MKKNMGVIDKALRILIAAVVLALYITNIITGTMGIVLLSVAVIIIITSLVGWCPLYIPFKLSTMKNNNK